MTYRGLRLIALAIVFLGTTILAHSDARAGIWVVLAGMVFLVDCISSGSATKAE